MARKSNTLTEVLLPFDDNADDGQGVEREAAALAQQMQQMGLDPTQDEYLGPPPELLDRQDAYITVFRIEPDSKKRLYVCRYVPTEFDLERLQREHGGGHFWIRLIAKNPANKGRPSIFWQDFVEVEGAPIVSVARPVEPGTALVSATPAPAVAMDQLAQTMLAGFERIASAMAGALAAARPAEPVNTRRDMIEEMRLLFEFMPKPAAQVNPMGMIRDLAGVLREMQPADADTSPVSVLLSAVDKLAPVLTTIVQSQASAPARVRRAAPAPAAALPAPSPGNEGPAIAIVSPRPANADAREGNPIEVNQMNADDLRFNIGLRFLLEAAKGDEDTELYADVVLSKVPADQITQLLSAPNWFELLVQRVPGIAQYREWFTELRDVLLEPDAPEPDDLTGGLAPGTVEPG